MKKISKQSIAVSLLAFIAFMALSCILSPAIAGGVVIAMGAGTASTETITTQTISDAESDINMEDISSVVTKMLPARTPMDTVMRKIRQAEKIASQEHGYYQVGSKPLYDVPNAAASGNGSSAASPAKAYSYVSGDGLTFFFIQTTNASLWSDKDTCLMRDLELPYDANGNMVLGGSAGTRSFDVAFAVSNVADNILKLTPLNGVKGLNGNAAKYVMPNFTAATKIYRMGKAMYQLDAKTDPYGIIPDKDIQYAQYFMCQVEEGVVQRMTKKEIQWGLNEYEEQNIYDMKATMEMSMLFGAKAYIPSPGNANQKIYFTGGITRDITKKLTYGTGGGNTTVQATDPISWCESVFVGNSGSEERLLLAGSTLMKGLHSVESISKQVNGRAPVVKWGIRVNEIVTEFGILNIVHAPLFSATGWAKKGLILDLEHVRKHEFLPMQVRDLELIKTGEKLADASVISEISCCTLRYPDCHGIVEPAA